MKVRNALLILSLVTNYAATNARTLRHSHRALPPNENEPSHKRQLKKSKPSSTDKMKREPELKSELTPKPIAEPSAAPHAPQSALKSKKLDDRNILGKGKKKKEPKEGTPSKAKSKKLDDRNSLKKDKKKKTSKNSRRCPSSSDEDEPPSPGPSAASVKKSKSNSKEKAGKPSSPVPSPTQTIRVSKELDDRHSLGKGRKTKLPDDHYDCPDDEDDAPSLQPTLVSPTGFTASPLASSVTTDSPVPAPTRIPSVPEMIPTAAPTEAPQLALTRAPSKAPIPRPVALPPVAKPVAPLPVPKPVAPPVAKPVAPPPVAPPVSKPVAAPVTPPAPRPVAPPVKPPTTPVSPAGGFETTLNLDNVADRFKAAFVNAGTTWDGVIIGDMSDFVVDASVLNSPNLKCDASQLPGVVDDIFICASVAPIDGPNGILGSAGPTSFRFDGEQITATIGFMNFDEDDMDLQREAGTLQGLILHEMAHVYGFGTMWDLNGLAPQTVPCPYKSDSRASEEYRKLSGCDGSIPVEYDNGVGTQCLHWDESCFMGELMTGSSSDGLELSILTIAALDDLGYTVDYSKADPFDTSKMNPDCVCNRRQLRGASEPGVFSYQRVDNIPRWSLDVNSRSHHLKPPLSDEGNRIARAYGLSILNANHEWKNAYLTAEQAERYIGDQIIVLLYMENGYKYTVIVKR